MLALTNKMGNLECDFDKAAVYTIPVPRRLIDQLLDALLFDGVDVGLPCLHEPFQRGARRLWMAVEQILADERAASIGLERPSRFGVHLQNDALRIANGDCPWKLLYPIMNGHHASKFCVTKDE